MSCSAQPANPNCLTSKEVGAVSKIWDGPRDPHGRRLWFGLDRGASLAGLDGSFPFPISTDHFAYWLHQNPSFDWHTITEASFVTDFLNSEFKFENVIGTDSTDLDSFIEHKAKDITYHGTADQLIFSRGTTNYFERLRKRYGAQNVDKFARLFMAPGMGHCLGGAGANAFGNVFGPPVSSDPQHDILKALVDWVEAGIPPDRITATKFINDNPASGVAFTRPLCVFPKLAAYKGSGDPTDAGNWTCANGIVNDTTRDADAVLPDRGNRETNDREGDDHD
jgi:hypothetical protein